MSSFGLSCCCSTPGGRETRSLAYLSLSLAHGVIHFRAAALCALFPMETMRAFYYASSPLCPGRARFFLWPAVAILESKRGVKRGNGFMILSNMKCIKNTYPGGSPKFFDVHDDCICVGEGSETLTIRIFQGYCSLGDHVGTILTPVALGIPRRQTTCPFRFCQTLVPYPILLTRSR
ncbi:hypothetical protein LX32DRAFT_142317 [Colletotrichum zoysiae]|uniref:Uncharacterized protein n=1 Tax=Colletotrichum zoysiae TaxID=1216348 RepID=A0AAD9H8T0_9PEZI|nr:hypothetical protein LX32DRAFT_142317 [Colletotrichum zoysiae]